jgi:hypothetical protein
MMTRAARANNTPHARAWIGKPVPGVDLPPPATLRTDSAGIRSV